MTLPRPPFDPELGAALSLFAESMPPTLTADMIQQARLDPLMAAAATMFAESGLEARDVTIPSYDGVEITLSVVQEPGRTGTGPGFYHVHGGGMVMGDRWAGVLILADWIRRYNGVVITVDYRLAPENPDPAPVEDSYAGLVWVGEHLADLGIEPDRLVIAGGSAGGGLAAGAALLARDRKGPELCAQMLMCPMLDDRDQTVSTHQIDGVGLWDRGSNITGWTALLGDRRATEDVSIYAAPARATDLSGLPPAYIDCGSAEVFRDEDVAYASAIWAAGGQAELHVWAGGFHGFGMVAHAAVSRQAVEARNGWLDRMMGV